MKDTKLLPISMCDDCKHCDNEYDNCGDYDYSTCLKTGKRVDNIRKIPEWCPLEEVK